MPHAPRLVPQARTIKRDGEKFSVFCAGAAFGEKYKELGDKEPRPLRYLAQGRGSPFGSGRAPLCRGRLFPSARRAGPGAGKACRIHSSAGTYTPEAPRSSPPLQAGPGLHHPCPGAGRCVPAHRPPSARCGLLLNRDETHAEQCGKAAHGILPGHIRRTSGHK